MTITQKKKLISPSPYIPITELNKEVKKKKKTCMEWVKASLESQKKKKKPESIMCTFRHKKRKKRKRKSSCSETIITGCKEKKKVDPVYRVHTCAFLSLCSPLPLVPQKKKLPPPPDLSFSRFFSFPCHHQLSVLCPISPPPPA